MISGIYIPGSSLIHRLDSRVKIAGFFLLLAALISCSSVYSYYIIFAALTIIVVLSKLPLRALFSSITRLRYFFILIFLLNALFYSSGEALFSWGIINVSGEGIGQGARIVVNVFFIMILANVLTGSTAPMDMTAGLASLLKPLKLLRFPAEDIAMIISCAMGFIPGLLEEADMIKKAQTARGARFESKKIVERIFSFPPLLIPVFMSAFRRADELALAMEARGYRNARDRTRKTREPLRARDFAALGCSIFVCIFQIFFWRFYL